MKKFIALLLIAVMTMGLVACGAKTEDKPSGTISNPGEFWGNKTENTEDNKENRKPVEKIEINTPEDYEYEQKPDFFLWYLPRIPIRSEFYDQMGYVCPDTIRCYNTRRIVCSANIADIWQERVGGSKYAAQLCSDKLCI